ncbi:MAG: PIN domain-containing protein [Candidatus Saccharimonadales bacterium]
MELLIAAVVLVIAAETTYLVVSQNKKTKHSMKKQMPIFVDTSVLIDGRITSIAQSGFITSTLYIPRSVVGELQFLADNADSDKRSRARHGLDVVSELQAMSRVNVEIFSDSTKAEEGVDNRLLSLAKQYKGAICTIDFNLNKVAQVEGIMVLNVNDLAMTLRMAYLPGEKTKLELIQKGNDQHQAVGHLPDGTMVVVEHASQFLGKIVEIEFIRGLQTAAGKMMFARIVGNQAPKPQKAVKTQSEQRQPKGRQPRPEQSEAVVEPQQRTDRPERAPRAPRPQRSEQSTTQQTAQPRQNKRQNNNRRRNNEDSLIELANKQQ